MGTIGMPLLLSTDGGRPEGSGLFAAGLRSVRRLPDSARERAARLPAAGLQVALDVAEAVLREYRRVRERGLRAALPFTGEADAEPAVATPPPAAPAPPPRRVGEPTLTVVPDAEPPAAAVEAGAPGVATETAERVEEAVESAGVADGATLSSTELPLPTYDQLTLGQIRGRLRRLDVADLVQLRDYEKAHANRLQVVTMLENRIAKLEAGADSDSDAD